MEGREQIEDREQLRAAYREPSQVAVDKASERIDAGAARFIASSPLVVLGTGSAERADASPRGGPPGFVRVLDEHRLAWGDLVGNNRLDTFQNVLDVPNIGLLFLVPGVEETLRVTGTVALVRDPEILAVCAIDGRTPKTAAVVTVRSCYIHCGAALRRSRLWDHATWPAPDATPSPAAILRDHLASERPAEEIEAGLAHYYDNFVWEPGGRAD